MLCKNCGINEREGSFGWCSDCIDVAIAARKKEKIIEPVIHKKKQAKASSLKTKWRRWARLKWEAANGPRYIPTNQYPSFVL